MNSELTDAQWALIQPHLPPPKKRGRPRAQDRHTINGILYVLRTGCRWHDLPPLYGSPVTCWRRLDQWQTDGVWGQIWRAFLAALDGQGQLDWSRAFLDGSFVPAKKQLSYRSRVLNLRSPGLSMFKHRIQDGQELAHAGREGYFPGLARPTKALVKGLDDGVISGGGQSSHIEGSPDPGPSAPEYSFASEAATISSEGSNAHQCGNLVAAQSAQFRQVGQEGDRHYWADPGEAAQQVVFLSPDGTLPNGVVQVLIQTTQFLLQPADMVLDPLTHQLRSRGDIENQGAVLGPEHPDTLQGRHNLEEL
jgi:transposase